MRPDQKLLNAVQFNCDLSDAHHAGDYTMCIYLMKMREYYRWENRIDFNQGLDMEAVGLWVQETESRWDDIESRGYLQLPIGNELLDPFNDAVVNRQLESSGLVYSSGLGARGKPVFNLAECLSRRSVNGLTVLIAGDEYAREISAPPAMLKDNVIYLRKQSLTRFIWECFEDWRWRRRKGPMREVVEHYGFESDFESALSRSVDDQLGQVLLHEIGEHRAGRELGSNWNAALHSVVGQPLEFVVRGFRDCLADCFEVLPAMASSQRPELFHFYIAALSPLRKELMPGLVKVYTQWCDGGTLAGLKEFADRGVDHFKDACQDFSNSIRRTSNVDRERFLDVTEFAL